MKTVTYEGDGLAVVLELQKPSMIMGVLASTARDCLLPLAKTEQNERMIDGFMLVLAHTRQVTGAAYMLPAWNSTGLEIIESFHQWASLDIDLCKWWIREVSSYNDSSPLSSTETVSDNTNGSPNPPQGDGSAKPNQKKFRSSRKRS